MRFENLQTWCTFDFLWEVIPILSNPYSKEFFSQLQSCMGLDKVVLGSHPSVNFWLSKEPVKLVPCLVDLRLSHLSLNLVDASVS